MRKIYLSIQEIFIYKNYKIAYHKSKTIKKVFLTSFVILFLFGLNSKVIAQGPGAQWEYYRPISLSSNTTLPDFQVKVILAAGQYGGMKSDGSDLRFYDNLNNSCNYWIEKWNNSGTSVIWVKVPTNGASSLNMYYGNPAASSISNGNTTFDFFDDFLGSSLSGNWSSNSAGGSIVVSGGVVSLNNNTNGIVAIASSFTPSPISSSFVLETKHKETGYNRNRFYATNISAATSVNNADNNPVGGDYGYFSNQIYWQGTWNNSLSANTDYLTSWNITDGGNYTWSTLDYTTGNSIGTFSKNVSSIIRTINIGVTELTNASTIVDWVRVRKSMGTTDITGSANAPVSTLAIPAIASLGSTEGCEGTQITINGTGFSSISNSVNIGGTPVASIVSNTANQIIAVIGVGTTGFVTVTTSGGSVTSSETFTVNPSLIVNAGVDIVSCNGANSFPMTGATATGAKTLIWSGGEAMGTFSGTGTNPATFNFNPTVPVGSFIATLTGTTDITGCIINPVSTRKISWGSAGSWLGVNSSNWNDPANWCGGVPTATTDVIIPPVGTVIYQPTINAPASCRNITINGTLDGANNNLDVYGNWLNNGTFTSSTGTVTFRGTSAQSIGGSAVNTFYKFIVNNNNGVTINKNVIISNTLTFTTGKIITGANVLSLTSTNGVVGAGPSNYVYGNLQKIINGNTATSFEIGDAAVYAPVTSFTFTGGTNNTGSIIASTTAGNHSQIASSFIDPAKSVKRYWTLSNSGVSGFTNYSATFNFAAGDISGAFGNNTVENYSSSKWSIQTTGTKTATSTTANSLVNFGDFQVGEEVIPTPCPATGNTLLGIADITHCINGFPSPEIIVSNTMTAGQYFTMNVIKGFIYEVYTNSSPANPLTISVYDDANPNAFVAFSYSNTGNPKSAIANNAYISFTSSFSGKVRVLINKKFYCGDTDPIVLTVITRVNNGSNTQDNPLNAGTNSWIGHIYIGQNTGIAFNAPFSSPYLGYNTENETFDQSFGGDQVCYNAFSNGSIRGTVFTDYFSVRYRMTSTKHGLYTVDIGSDDGSRLAVDGTLVYNDWSGHGWANKATNLISLNGNSSLVLDYFEATGGNRISFNNLKPILSNILSTNITQTLCSGSIGVTVASGDTFGTLPAGITLSGTGYQWTYSTTPAGARTVIPGATGATYIPTAIAPFDNPGTYYIYRNATLRSDNNVNVPAYIATNESNPVTLTVTTNPLSVNPITGGASSFCLNNSTTQFTNSTAGGTWGIINGTGTASINSSGLVTGLTSGDAQVIYTITDGGNCSKFAAQPITIRPLPISYAVTGSGTYCATATGLFLTLSNSETGVNYQAYNGATAVGSPVAGSTGISKTFAIPTTSGTYTIVGTNTATGCSTSMTGNVVIIINPLPTGTLAVDNLTSCKGDILIFTASTGFNNYVFKIGATILAQGASNTFSSATIPNGSSLSVTVTDLNGCTNTFAPVILTVNDRPTGNFNASETSGLPNDNIICAGSTVNFSFDNIQPAYTTYQFLINGSTEIYKGSNPYFSTTSLANNDLATLIVTTSAGCTQAFGPIQFRVDPFPVIAGSITGSTTVCQGQNTVIYTVPAITFATGYNWTVPTGASIISGANTNSITVNFSNSAISGNVYVEGVNACGSGTGNSLSITVNPLPDAPGTITGYGTVCQGQSAVIYTVPAINNSKGYTWTLPSGATIASGANTNSITVNFSTTASDGNITVTGTNDCGSGIISANFPVKLNLLPSAAGTIVGKSSLCVGTNSVSYSVPAINNATSYKWSYSGTGATITGTTNSVTINFSSTATSGALTVTGVNSCGEGIVSSDYNITVNPLPTGTLTSNATNNTICSGTSITFTASVANGTNYQFFVDGNSVQNSALNTYATTSLTANATITVIITNANGCTGTWDPLNITVNPLPNVTLDGPNPICQGTSGNIYSTESGKNNYVWNITGGTIDAGGTSANNTVSVTWISLGNKTINVNYTDANGCSAATSATFTSSPTVKPEITGVNTVCLNSTGIKYTTDGDDSKSDYTWIVNGGTIVSGGGTSDYSVTVNWDKPTGPHSVSINYSNTDGCNAASPSVLPVIVNALPTAIISGTVSVCQGATAPNITFTGSAGKREYTFTYNINSGVNTTVTTTSGNTQTVSQPSGTPGVFTYNLISVSDANGCTQPATGSTTVTVTPTPSANISYTGGPSFCTSTGPVSVTLAGTTGGTYSSAPAGLSIAADGTITPSSSNAGNYTITYTIAPAGGCGIYSTNTSVTITKLPTATISYGGTPYCKSVTAAQPVTRNGSGAYTGGAYSAVPAGLTINTSTGAITPGTSAPGIYTITYSTPASGGCGVVSATASVTITDVPSATISYTGTPYCISLTSAPVTLTGTGAITGGTYASSAGLKIDASTGMINPSNSTPGTYTVNYVIPNSGGCGSVLVTTSVTITPAATVNAGDPIFTCASAATVNITSGSKVTNESSFVWTASGTGMITNPNSLTAATYTTTTADISNGSVTLTLTATGNGNCGKVLATKTLTIGANPPAVIIKPDNATYCLGTVQPLTSVLNGVTGGNQIFTSTTNNVAIPDNNYSGIANPINVTGIPSNAIISSINVTLNITHPADVDIIANLRAPNNKELNLINSLSGANFTNTVLSSASSSPIQTFGTAPYTGVYSPNAVVGAMGSAFSASFTNLYTTASSLNGNWILKVSDNGLGSTGTLNSWSITINYSTPVTPIPVTWLPATDLYIDAAATLPYSGESLATVYAKLSTPGIRTYTATSGNAAGCTSSNTVTLTGKPSPTVKIVSDYCSTPGKVTLIASAPDAVSYNWSNGATTATTFVDIAHKYYASVTNSDGCVGTNVISIAQELVVNGDFTAGNTGFISGYNYKADIPNVNNELVDDTGNNGYAVGTDGQNYHNSFYGQDHTNNQTGDRNFMLVNGHGTITVWEQTVTVEPNTYYYYSAWAMNLNPSSPARLRFEVNGVQIGTTADLNTAPKPQSNAEVNLNNWVRFYYGNTSGWYSGSATTAVIRIVDLNEDKSGNDFGLDDISFATLSPFVTGPGKPGSNNQVVCTEQAIDTISYKVGSGAEGPQVNGLPAGVNYTFDGSNLLITGVPTTAGTYNYTVFTTGPCANPKAATGTIVVKQSALLSLTSPASTTTQTVCIGSSIDPITYSVTGGGTGAGVTWTPAIPAGVFGAYNNGVFTISGFPTQSGTFTYTVTTTGSCLQKTATGTITVTPASVGGSLNSPTLCLGQNASLTLTGNSGNVIGWEFSTDGGTSWTPITNTTNTLSYTITGPATFRALSKNNTCSVAYSTPGKVQVNNLWEGKISNSWTLAANWSSGNLPNINDCSNTITIPKGVNFDPVLIATTPVINLNILTNGHLTINGSGNLQVAGAITNSGGILDASKGGIELTGSAPQTIAAGTFLNNAINDLKISNSNAAGVVLSGPIDIYRSLTFSSTGKNLNTNDQLTIKSSAAQTAWIGDLTGHTINGNVTVERYINIGTGAGQHAKAWEFLAIPTTGNSIYKTWMEGGSMISTGYGTQITGQGTGFDVTSPSPSMKYYDPSSSLGWKGITNTADLIYNPQGYMVFVRGDRSVDGQTVVTAKPTTLRTSGKLLTGDIPFTVNANSFASIGNPYASSIDMRTVSADRTWTGDDFFTVWNSNMGGSYGYGVYVTYIRIGTNYIATPGDGNGINNFIQSGQAFFVQNTSNSAGKVMFKEHSKANGSVNAFFRPEGTSGRAAELRTNLFSVGANDARTLADGTFQQFSDDYSNAIDEMDARKFFNSSENLSIRSGGKDLIIERKHTINNEDTIFYNLTSVKVQNYHFEFTANGLSANGLEGFVEDTYLKTRTPLNLEGVTELDFAVTNVAASYAPNRFRIVFKTAVVLPVTFVSVKAYAKNADITVEWKVENESSMQQYEVEKSIDGSRFTKAATIAAGNSGAGSYGWLDQKATAGYNYYRIRSIDMNGKTNYTQTVKVLMGSIASEIVIYPNPIVNGIVNLKFTNQPAGKYGIRLLNPLGQVIISKQIERAEGNSSESIKWDYNLAHGVYQLEVTKPDGGIKVIKVMY